MKCPICGAVLLLPEISLKEPFSCPNCHGRLEAINRHNKLEAYIILAVSFAAARVIGARSGLWLIVVAVAIFGVLSLAMSLVFLLLFPPDVLPARPTTGILGLADPPSPPGRMGIKS